MARVIYKIVVRLSLRDPDGPGKTAATDGRPLSANWGEGVKWDMTRDLRWSQGDLRWLQVCPR